MITPDPSARTTMGLAEHQAPGRARPVRIEAQAGQVQHGTERGLGLQPGQMSTQAEVRAVGEGEVQPRVRAADVESVRVGEDRRVASRACQRHADQITSPDRGRADPGVAGRTARPRGPLRIADHRQ
jgi:hypothetical protein